MTEYKWRVGDVFENGHARWCVERVVGERAVLCSCASEWATTKLLTFEEWTNGGWRLVNDDNDTTLPMVEGMFCLRSLGEFERACLVHLAEEQSKPSPDTALIRLLCDAVRLKREFSSHIGVRRVE